MTITKMKPAMAGMKSIGENNCQLLRSVESKQVQVSLLDRLVGPRKLTAADDVVAPLHGRIPSQVLAGEPHMLPSHNVLKAAHFNSRHVY